MENDSSPLDGQQEKTRAHPAPVARQQDLLQRSAARPPASLDPKRPLLFFDFVIYCVLENCAYVECGRPSAAFFIWPVPFVAN